MKHNSTLAYCVTVINAVCIATDRASVHCNSDTIIESAINQLSQRKRERETERWAGGNEQSVYFNKLPRPAAAASVGHLIS